MRTMFIDTNVLVYASFRSSPNFQMSRKLLDKVTRGSEPVRISNQVIREYFSTITRRQKWAEPFTVQQSLNLVEVIRNKFDVLENNQEVLTNMLYLCREFSVSGKGVHDANIVATMLTFNEKRLLTYDTGFKRYAKLIDLVEVE